MLTGDEEAIVRWTIEQYGLTERNILAGLTEQQRRVWVHSALLGKTDDEIRDELFSTNKRPASRSVRCVLFEARLRIITNLLQDDNVETLLEECPQLKENIEELIKKVKSMRRKRSYAEGK